MKVRDHTDASAEMASPAPIAKTLRTHVPPILVSMEPLASTTAPPSAAPVPKASRVSSASTTSTTAPGNRVEMAAHAMI
jgi:hypothetical protein